MALETSADKRAWEAVPAVDHPSLSSAKPGQPQPSTNTSRLKETGSHLRQPSDRDISITPPGSTASTAHEKTDVEKEAADVSPAQDSVTSAPDAAVTQEDSKGILVDFNGPDDSDNPRNWSKRRRWLMTISGGLLTFTVTFSSSIWSVGIPQFAEEYHVSEVVSTLGVSLFLVGFIFGPLIFGPISEAFGRKWPLLGGYVVFALFQIQVALGKNVQTVMIGRFLSGFSASSPLAVVGGLLADLWDPINRAYGICAFALGGFAGPVVGPIVGGFIVDSYLGWRWTAWITLILAAPIGLFGFSVISETSAPRILQLRAARLRRETGDNKYYSKADENPVTFNRILTVYLIRPFQMIVQEPILALITAYMSFIYGILYLLFNAFPISFREQRGWNAGVGSLPFIPFIVGMVIGAAGIAYSTATNFKRALLQNNGQPVPEERLPPMIFGAIALPIGLFWFAWTSNPHITWVPQVLSSACTGGGLMVAFWQGLNYIIDCYGFYSNSAIAVNTFTRSIAGAGFPLFAPAMYHKLGVDWATSILAFLCVVFAPVPILFYYYGARIRKRSKFVPTD